MITIYTVKCKLPEIATLRSTLADKGHVLVVQSNEVATTNPKPDLIFFSWGAAMEDPHDNEEDRRLRLAAVTAMSLAKMRKALLFRDVPLIVIAEKRDFEDAQMAIRYGATHVISLPLDSHSIGQLIEETLRPAGQDARIDARLVNPFVEATLEVLRIMAHIEVKRSEVLLKRDYRLFGEASAVLGIMGKDLDGSVGLTFHEDLVREIIASMWNKKIGDITKEDINDGLGELANVISGKATTLLSQNSELCFTLTLPTIVTGYGHEVSHRPGVPCLVIVFEANGKPFALQIALAYR
jgi:chemotaxis protein CheX